MNGFISSKSVALVYYLAATRQTHRRDHLADLLWGEFSEQKARKNLRHVLSNLRTILGPYFTITWQEAALKKGAPCIIDVEKFALAMQDVETITGNYLSPATIAILREGLELYSGDFLEGFQLANAPDNVWLSTVKLVINEA